MAKLRKKSGLTKRQPTFLISFMQRKVFPKQAKSIPKAWKIISPGREKFFSGQGAKIMLCCDNCDN